jgi:hypothetical protein
MVKGAGELLQQTLRNDFGAKHGTKAACKLDRRGADRGGFLPDPSPPEQLESHSTESNQ